MSVKITFRYDRRRAVQAVLWLLKDHGGAMDKLKLVKLVFLADREHLTKYGRPIVGGTYCAMPLGPVSSELLDDLNESTPTEEFPLELRGNRVLAKDALDEDWLSESDVEVLGHVNAEYGGWDTFRLSDMTHKLQAYRKNYEENSTRRSLPLPYEDFFLDLPNLEMLAVIRDDQEARAAFE